MRLETRHLPIAMVCWFALACAPPDAGELADSGSEGETTGGDSETGDEGEPVPSCIDPGLGCMSEEHSDSSGFSCELDCEIEAPCPTSLDSAFGHSVNTASVDCIVETLQSQSEPAHFEYGTAEETDPNHEYYYIDQWDLWVVEDDHAILRRVREYTEYGEVWGDASVIGGELPSRDVFGGCTDGTDADRWECVIDQIEWCSSANTVGPTGERPWCPG